MEAYEKRSEFESELTDDAQLVEALGHAVTLVESDFSNLKITTRADITLAQAIIRSRPKLAPKGPRAPFEEAQW